MKKYTSLFFTLAFVLFLGAGCDSYTRGTSSDPAPQQPQSASEEMQAAPQDAPKDSMTQTDAKSGVAQKIENMAMYAALTESDRAELNLPCDQQNLGDLSAVKKLTLFKEGTFSVMLYATPNSKNLTTKEARETAACQELGSLLAIKATPDHILWWSQLGCGHEVGEYFGNATDASRACEKVHAEVLAYQQSQL